MDLPELSHEHRRRIACIATSYERLAGRALVAGAERIAGGKAGAAASDVAGDVAREVNRLVAALWTAPLAIVAHGLEADPVFFFGNRTALTLFEMDFASFTRLPSRLSAEPMDRDERARLLERVANDGIIYDYAGVRISVTGRRFRIEGAAVWNVVDEAGVQVGQAAGFEKTKSECDENRKKGFR